MPKTMTTASRPKLGVKRPTPAAPFVIQFFLVQGLGFRCAAYCDLQGIWRDASNHQELFGDIRILDDP